MLIKNTVLAVALLASTFGAQAATQKNQCDPLRLIHFFDKSTGFWTNPAGENFRFKTEFNNLAPGKFSARFTSPTNPLNFVVAGTCDNNGDKVTVTSIEGAGNIPDVNMRLIGRFDELGTLRVTDGKYTVVITATK